VREKLRPESVVVFDEQLCAGGLPGAGSLELGVDASAIAKEVEAPMSISLVLLSALCGATGLVALASLIDAMQQAIPPYRSQHIATNRRALEAGHAALAEAGLQAWSAADR
jgi:Pyruvate/2-oxoacid:ferredoxin oxidoreductase gamma subunit